MYSIIDEKTALAATALSLVRDGRVGLDATILDQSSRCAKHFDMRQGSQIMVNMRIITLPLLTMRRMRPANTPS